MEESESWHEDLMAWEHFQEQLASSKVVLSTKLMPVPLPQRTFLVDKPCLGGVGATASKSFAITNCLIFNWNCTRGCLQASAKRC